jgi:hypothetical protein
LQKAACSVAKDGLFARRPGSRSRSQLSSSLSDLWLVVQNHVQQGIMDFQFSVVFDETQFAELVHEKAYA